MILSITLLLMGLQVVTAVMGNTSSLPAVHSGYWRIVDNSTSVLQCPYGVTSCHGGEHSGDASCDSHFQGYLCSVPVQGLFIDWTFRDAYQCSSTVVSLSLLASLAIGIVLPFWICCCIGSTKDPKKFMIVKERNDGGNEFKTRSLLDSASIEESTIDGVSSEFLSFKSFSGRRGDKDVKKLEITSVDQNNAAGLQLLVKLKIVIFSMQIVSSLPNSLMRQLPYSSTNILRLYSYLSWASIQALPLNCIADSLGVMITYQNSMELATIIPLMAALLATFLYLLHIEILYVISTKTKYFQRKQKQVSLRYGALVGMFVYILWGGVSSVIVGSFECVDVDPENFVPGAQTVMRNDVNVYCGTTSYKYGYLWTVLALLLYVILLPMLIALVLYFYKAAVAKDIESLIDRYETDALTSETIEQLFHRSMTPSDTPTGDQLKEGKNRREFKSVKKSSGGSRSAVSEASAVTAIKKFKNKLSEYYDAVGILHMAYKKDYKYWELFDYLIRFVYLALLPLSPPENQTSQLLVFIVVTTLFLTRTLYCRPFRDSGNQILFSLSLIQVASVAVCIVITEIQSPDSSLFMIDALLCLSLLSVPSLFLWQTLVPVIRRRWTEDVSVDDTEAKATNKRSSRGVVTTPSTAKSGSSRRTRSTPSRTPDSTRSSRHHSLNTRARLPTHMDSVSQWEQYQLSLQRQDDDHRILSSRSSRYDGPLAPPSPDSSPPPSPPPLSDVDDDTPYSFEESRGVMEPRDIVIDQQFQRFQRWEQHQRQKSVNLMLRENERLRQQVTEQRVQLDQQERRLQATSASYYDPEESKINDWSQEEFSSTGRDFERASDPRRFTGKSQKQFRTVPQSDRLEPDYSTSGIAARRAPGPFPFMSPVRTKTTSNVGTPSLSSHPVPPPPPPPPSVSVVPTASPQPIMAGSPPRPPPPPPREALRPAESVEDRKDASERVEHHDVSVEITVGGNGGGCTTLRVPTGSLQGKHLDHNPHDTFDALLEDALLTEHVLNLEYGDIYSMQSEDLNDDYEPDAGQTRIRTVKNKETGRVERYRRSESADFSDDDGYSEVDAIQSAQPLPLHRIV